ncbi:HalOD1 output domain-containing protein [Haladaptatus sp. NG-WS-4]
METRMDERTSRKSEGHLTVAVLTAVMDAAGYEDASEFETCLYDVIDPDALDALFYERSVSGYVEFAWDGFDVLVYSNGCVEVVDT